MLKVDFEYFDVECRILLLERDTVFDNFTSKKHK